MYTFLVHIYDIAEQSVASPICYWREWLLTNEWTPKTSSGLPLFRPQNRYRVQRDLRDSGSRGNEDELIQPGQEFGGIHFQNYAGIGHTEKNLE